MAINDSVAGANGNGASGGGADAGTGYTPEVYDLLLDAAGKLAAECVARAQSARDPGEARAWERTLEQLRAEVAAVNPESNAAVIAKRNELIYRLGTLDSRRMGGRPLVQRAGAERRSFDRQTRPPEPPTR